MLQKNVLAVSNFRRLDGVELVAVAGGGGPSDPRFDEFGNLKEGYFITDDGKIMSSDPLDIYTVSYGGDGSGDGGNVIVVTGERISDSSSGSGTSSTPEGNGGDINDPTSELHYVLSQMGLIGTFDQAFMDNYILTLAAEGASFEGTGITAAEVEERRINAVAYEAQSIINSLGEDGNEHGFFIIKNDDGSIVLGQYHKGDAGEIKFGGDNALSLDETGATSWDNVIGFVHNHPETTDYSFAVGDPNEWNKTPSESDWQILDGINQFNQNTNFQLFIIDYRGDMRAYDADSDRNRNAETDKMEEPPEDGSENP